MGGDLMSIASQHNPGPGSRALEGKYLTFHLKEEVYGIGIRRVKEIIGLMNITPVPQTPEYVKGVINLRGKVIPVVDLRSRFSILQKENTNHTCIIVVEIDKDAGKVPVGIIVDEVAEVLNIKGAEIENTPSFGSSMNMDFLLGIAKVGGGVKLLLDINEVLTSGDFAYDQVH
jgi:purine-binding chemotaxis protein CheW